MTLWKESCLYALLCSLWDLYEASALHRLLCRLGRWCTRQVDESRILRPLCRQGVVARAWPESVSCRLLGWVVNLPGLILRRLYLFLQPTFGQSVFARLAFAMGDETAIAQSWLIMALWCIPFSRWNNAYSLMAFAFLLVLFYAGAMASGRRLDMEGIGFYPVVLFASMFLAVIFSYSPSLSFRFLIYHISAALCVVVTLSAVRNSDDLKRLAAGGAVCVAVSGSYGILQRLQGIEVNESYVDLTVNAGMPGRVYSIFDNPNTFAQVLIILLPLVLALVWISRHWYTKLLCLGTCAIGAAALGMTYSRASWVGMACAMVVLVFLWKPRLIPGFFVLCCLCIPFLPQTIWNRILTITNTADSSSASRMTLWQAALEVIRKSPVSGAGLGTAATQSFIRDFNLYHDKAPFVHSHSFYLEVWVQAGLLGISSFVGSMLWNIKQAAHTVRRVATTDSDARTLTCAAAASLCGAMVCGLADFLWNYPRVMCIFFFVFAMALAGVKVCRAEARENPPSNT